VVDAAGPHVTRRAGQVRTGQALAGLAVLVLAAAAVVALCRWLLPTAAIEATLPEPAQAAVSACPRPLPKGDQPVAVSAGDLVACPHSYDGVTVRYRGEVVAAVLLRGERAWVQLNDDAYGVAAGPLPEHRTALGGNSGIAVSVPATAGRRITIVGGHRAAGDLLEVVGPFLRADPGDAGGPTIRATQVRTVQDGRRLQHAPSPRLLGVAGTLLALTALGGLTLRLSRRTRRVHLS
jgi:hypothetical protein